MKKGRFLKAIVSLVVLFVLLIASAQTMSTVIVPKTITPTASVGWYWKPSYPNYAPQGLPDFSQQQDQWKRISPGPNGTIDSTVVGDDIYNSAEDCIAPGQNCHLDSDVTGDDVVKWIFCGPVAVANCFWWFDSKYAYPYGIPGDGKDNFNLVKDYGVGDDHTPTNAPLLIENLARAMNTTDKGTTYIDDMYKGIAEWFNSTNLSKKFTVKTYNQPTFSNIASEIERNRSVILLLESYNTVVGPLTIDQSQTQADSGSFELCKLDPWTDFQGFIPSVPRLDAIQIFMECVDTACNVQINVYEYLFQTDPIGTSIINPGILSDPTWIEFTFTPEIALIPGGYYYFDVYQLESGYHYKWFFKNGNPYPPGQGWMNGIPCNSSGYPFDWTFKTEYFNPPPHSEKCEEHYFTCAGVNSAETMIALSDPTLDIANPTQVDHNDTANVSYDIYNVSLGAPQPDIDCEWWLSDYHAGYDYSIVDQAVIITPGPDTEPPILGIAKPVKAFYFLNNKIMPLSEGILIIGKIDVIVNTVDYDSGMDRVEFYVDSDLGMKDEVAPYNWLWSERSFFSHTLRIKAFDKDGNVASEVIEVWKFF